MAQRMRDAQDTPFGVRAMMHDPDVDGVWNSRASTPLHSPILGPRNTSPSRNPFSRSRRSSSLSIIKVNITDPKITPLVAASRIAQVDGAFSLHRTCKSSTSPVTTPKRVVSESSWQSSTPTCAVTLDTTPRRRSVTIRATPPANVPPSSSHTSIRGELSVTPSTVNTLTLTLTDSRTSRMHEHDWTDRSSAVTTPEQRRRSLLIENPSPSDKDLNRTPTTKKALDRMEAHRRFHAAESGQLHPRSKSSSTGSSVHEHTVSKHLLLDSENTRAVSWPIMAGEILVNFEPSQKVQTMTSPQVVPFRAFVEMHPPPPTKAPPSAWTARTQGLMDDKLHVCQRIPPSRKRVTISNNSPFRISTPLDGATADVEEKFSTLSTQTRTVNAGFEVLPAGALDFEKSARVFSFARRPLGEKSNDTSKPRKLHKRSLSRDRRPSLESTYETVAL